jgi:hypothetical protein
VKDLAFDVLAPDELGEGNEGPLAFPDWRVNWRRFAGECRKLIHLMDEYAGTPL